METALPKPPLEVPVQDDVQLLAPTLRVRIALVLAEMHTQGHTPRVFETLRTNERQTFLYGFDRDYDDGRGRVTNAETAARSWHHYGLAADIICAQRGWDAPAAFWSALGASAQRHGLTWGGDWNSDGRSTDETMLDRPHVQWGAPMRRSPSTRAIALLASGGFAAVWSAVGAS